MDKLNWELSSELEPYRDAIAATIAPYIKIELTDDDRSTWWQSKFGGLPYLPQNFDYPTSYEGKYLYLLAQINFSEVPPLENLPDRGILQFYIADDGMYGCDLGNPTRQDKFRVIYFESASLPEEELRTDFSFLPPVKPHGLPFKGCSTLKFTCDRAPMTPSDYRFNIFDLDNASDELCEAYWDKFAREEHKILGYPNFIQDDPRAFSQKSPPDILLLQIKSDRRTKIDLVWGDLGIANFFIKADDLAKLDFSRVLYNWDCS